jgi:hypothetical protein
MEVVICVATYLVGATIGGLLLGRWFYVSRQYRVLLNNNKKQE